MQFNIVHILLALAVLNIVTFCLYGLDKYYARHDIWRVPEAVLLFLALIGGSPAAYIAQKFFRHKIHKFSFRIKFWLIVIVQCTTFVAWYMNYLPIPN